MARKRYSDEDVLNLLRQIELSLASGSSVETACRAAMSNAVFDALYKAGVSHFDMPATSERVWRAIHRKNEKATP